MKTILAIDPAWTLKEPSGVALVTGEGDSWHCLALAPCYDDFYNLAEGTSVNWKGRVHKGASPQPTRLLAAAKRLSPTGEVNLVAIDMPISRIHFSTRREADNEISRHFGGRWCSAHSPGVERPGPLSALFSNGLGAVGFDIATTATSPGTTPALIEVYPHPALLKLMGAEKRLPYKVSKAVKYWPSSSRGERLRQLIQTFEAIQQKLTSIIHGIELPIPSVSEISSFSALKRFEDSLDALVSAWVGICYLTGNAVPYGDHHAAIWVPAHGDPR